MTYWKQFAEMFGLELEEEFRLVKPDGTKVDNDLYKITEDGLFSIANDLSGKVTLMLDLLLSGDYKAVPKPWKPKYGEQYWSYSTKINGTCCNTFWELIEDYAMWKSGNCFRTEEEAKTKGKEIMEKLVKEYEEA